MSRVLSTQEAKDAIVGLQRAIDNEFVGAVDALQKQADVLTNQDFWDGALALEFREATWPDVKGKLESTRTALGQLREQLDVIAKDIFTAGGSEY